MLQERESRERVQVEQEDAREKKPNRFGRNLIQVCAVKVSMYRAEESNSMRSSSEDEWRRDWELKASIY